MGSGRGRPQCSYYGDMGHWVQKCFQLHGYPPGHPKARMNLGSNSNQNKSFSTANQVSEADEGKPAIALLEAQLKQLLSLLNNQDENSSSKVNAVTKPDLAMRRTIGLGKQLDELYYLVALATEKSLTNHSSSTNQPACNLTISSTDLWHSGLGHVSPSRLSFIAKNFLNFSIQSNNAYPICPLAKQIAYLLCALTAVHIINRLPSPVLSLKTPFELLYSKPPSYSHLHVFKCLAYATNVHTSHKFDYRAMPSIFIGYPAVSPSPVPPFASIPSAPPVETPIFSPETHSPKPATPLHRSNRHITPPIKLHDYVCSHVSSDQSSSLIPGPTKEPRSYSEAAAHPEWQEAMHSELQALQANGTCTIGSEGFTQLEGVDYRIPFPPLPRSYLFVACLHWSRDWSLHQMDVNNAFLHGDLHEENICLYRQGFGDREENLVCHLHKSLYGLKQASRQWFAKFSKAIRSVGYAQSRADYSLFTRKQGKSFTALLIYVDDILIIGNDPMSIATTKKFMHSHFHLKDLGDLKYFLGIEEIGWKVNISNYVEARYHLCSSCVKPFMHQPRKAHMEAVFRVVRYLRMHLKVHYRLLCIPWTFTDFLEIKATENIVTLFTEAEYRAMTGACCELTWLRFDYSYQSEEIPQALVVMALNEEEKDPNFYVDSGATTHIKNGPEIKKKLLSIGQLTSDNPCSIEFSSTGFVIKDQLQQVLARGTKKRGLYALEENVIQAMTVTRSSKASSELWHQRMGHPQTKSIKLLQYKNFIEFQNLVENQLERWIKIFQRDGGDASCETSKIDHQTTSWKENTANQSSNFKKFNHTHALLSKETSFSVEERISASCNTNQNTEASCVNPTGTPTAVATEISIVAASTNDHNTVITTETPLMLLLVLVAQFNTATTTGTLSQIESTSSYKPTNVSNFPDITMQEEIKALIQNRTWDLVPRPPTANIVGSKWVFKTKLKEDGTIDRYKARLVAQVALGWTMRQLDVKNAFLHGFLKEVITGNDNNIISDLISTLSSEFSLKYTRDFLEHTKMMECTHINTPMALKSIITPSDERPIDPTRYSNLLDPFNT
ncbi:Retrovirus-related Pol polyprotein from transposon TNT 1-94 [Vitis vinifera]|uniref:Retrovirus-related Pol polyprotein from transposon TNT 1-94 n=1 Tax=Vitis vinifera TaxID=29760 RepID=A0A438H162_VITVI|nr:Retrovirus-related Pol polyprotein from transposon TNT 1-94 [Vitis vinifera]